MALTVQQATVVLNRRLGECAPLADLQDSFSLSLSYLDITPVTIGAVVDQDIAGIVIATYPQFMDIAEWRAIESILMNLDQVTLFNIGVTGNIDKIRLKYQKIYEVKSRWVEKTYGIGLPTLAVGVIDMNFQAECNPTDPTTWGF